MPLHQKYVDVVLRKIKKNPFLNYPQRETDFFSKVLLCKL